MDTLIENTKEVSRLFDIHTAVAGGGRGRKRGVEVLNKSGVVLLVACWEAYVEDLARGAFDQLLKSSTSPSTFPEKVLTLASRALTDALDKREVWKLAGDGWRAIITDHREEALKRFIAGFNTPRAERVDELFESLIGLRRLSASWSWHRVSADATRDRLGKLIELRGQIAHRVSTSRSVKKQDITKSIDFVYRLAILSHMKVRQHLHSQLGTYPWGEYYFVAG